MTEPIPQPGAPGAPPTSGSRLPVATLSPRRVQVMRPAGFFPVTQCTLPRRPAFGCTLFPDPIPLLSWPPLSCPLPRWQTLALLTIRLCCQMVCFLLGKFLHRIEIHVSRTNERPNRFPEWPQHLYQERVRAVAPTVPGGGPVLSSAARPCVQVTAWPCAGVR